MIMLRLQPSEIALTNREVQDTKRNLDLRRAGLLVRHSIRLSSKSSYSRSTYEGVPTVRRGPERSRDDGLIHVSSSSVGRTAAQQGLTCRTDRDTETSPRTSAANSPVNNDPSGQDCVDRGDSVLTRKDESSGLVISSETNNDLTETLAGLSLDGSALSSPTRGSLRTADQGEGLRPDGEEESIISQELTTPNEQADATGENGPSEDTSVNQHRVNPLHLHPSPDRRPDSRQVDSFLARSVSMPSTHSGPSNQRKRTTQLESLSSRGEVSGTMPVIEPSRSISSQVHDRGAGQMSQLAPVPAYLSRRYHPEALSHPTNESLAMMMALRRDGSPLDGLERILTEEMERTRSTRWRADLPSANEGTETNSEDELSIPRYFSPPTSRSSRSHSSRTRRGESQSTSTNRPDSRLPSVLARASRFLHGSSGSRTQHPSGHQGQSAIIAPNVDFAVVRGGRPRTTYQEYGQSGRRRGPLPEADQENQNDLERFSQERQVWASRHEGGGDQRSPRTPPRRGRLERYLH